MKSVYYRHSHLPYLIGKNIIVNIGRKYVCSFKRPCAIGNNDGLLFLIFYVFFIPLLLVSFCSLQCVCVCASARVRDVRVRVCARVWGGACACVRVCVDWIRVMWVCQKRPALLSIFVCQAKTLSAIFYTSCVQFGRAHDRGLNPRPPPSTLKASNHLLSYCKDVLVATLISCRVEYLGAFMFRFHPCW